ncbi:MAG: hypothetical protein VB144_10105 [Clostridia bacterium]|nr:hypothetical protein [Clostridia bacterium]
MEYQATVCRLVRPNDYEGLAVLSILGQDVLVSYQAPMEFALQKLTPDAVIPVDLWHVYGKAVKIYAAHKAFPTPPDVAGGTIRGQIIDVMSPTEFRVDCGLLMDVENRTELKGIAPGDFIEIRGTYQVYFPGTEWDR